MGRSEAHLGRGPFRATGTRYPVALWHFSDPVSMKPPQLPDNDRGPGPTSNKTTVALLLSHHPTLAYTSKPS